MNQIDVGVFITVTNGLVKKLGESFLGSITFEKAIAYYTHFKNLITIPLLFIGLKPDL